MYQFKEAEHIHTFEGQPLYGTTTLIKEVLPPFLAKWGGQCTMDYIFEHQLTFATLLTTGIREEIDAFAAKAVNAWLNVRNAAGEKGTDMHAELEKYVSGCLENQDGVPIGGRWAHEAVQKFSEWSVKNVEKFIFSEKNTYSKSLWCGGVVDCLARMKDGKLAVIDFKSSKAVYFNHVVQTAGYALQLEESGYGNADGSEWTPLGGKIESLVVVAFGMKKLQPETFNNVDGFKDVFRHMAAVYPMLLAFNKRNK